MSRYRLRSAFLAAAYLFVSHVAFAQNTGYKFDSMTISSGQNAISGGLTGTARFVKNDTRYMEVTVQQEQGWLMYGRKFKSGSGFNGLILGSAGHFQGSPWVGPFLSME